MRRLWHRDGDGTYFRNLPLIRWDMDRPINRVLPWRAWVLRREWSRAWGKGLIRADKIGRFDRVATPISFREAYPDHPALWVLDEPNLGVRDHDPAS